jgi:SAM-dependent methyltransferase
MIRIFARSSAFVILSGLLILASVAPRVLAADAPEDTTVVGGIRHDAAALKPIMRSPLAQRFLAATEALPEIQPRTVRYDSSRTHFYNEEEFKSVPDSVRMKGVIVRTLDGGFYYNTRYGSPLAYSRPLQILSEAGFKDVTSRRIVDFGYGTIGHLRLLASLGADVTGIEVDPILRTLYSWPGDQGEIAGYHGPGGKLRVVHGHYPAEPALTADVGEGYDLFISKNTLKNGYLHPAQPVDRRMLVTLGVDDSAFVQNLWRILKPGGYAMIYNLCPAPAPPDKPYIPWADGRCPFPKEMWTGVGFKILAFDRDDSAAARVMAHALAWDAGQNGMNLEKDLFGTYTLVQKPSR